MKIKKEHVKAVVEKRTAVLNDKLTKANTLLEEQATKIAELELAKDIEASITDPSPQEDKEVLDLYEELFKDEKPKED